MYPHVLLHPCDGGIEAMARAQRSRKIPCIENAKLKRRRREREKERG
jgi:hypothetical protein